MTDNSWRQRHVGLAVAYNAWHFYQATGDTGWLAGRGADLIVEVARSFRSMPTTSCACSAKTRARAAVPAATSRRRALGRSSTEQATRRRNFRKGKKTTAS